jgi:hypothetical protein
MKMSDSQGNTENCKLRAFEKNNYFYGKLMTVRDFVLEQQYVNDKRWLINNLLFGSGTVCGLNVSTVDMGLVVKSGFAIDKCGREIILPENVSLTLADKDKPSATTKKAIYISYKECPKERVRAQTASTCDEVCANNRIEESYSFDIRDVQEGGSDITGDELCGIWSNNVTKVCDYQSSSARLRFKRKAKKYVSAGDLFEISLEITNLDNSMGSAITILDTLPSGLKLVEGSNAVNRTILPGETIKNWYVVKVDANPSNELILKVNINGEAVNDSDSIIKVKSQREISENLFKELIDLSTKPCLEGDIDPAVEIAELIWKDKDSIIVDNTKRKIVNNNKDITKMLECLRVHASALENQTIGIKNKLAPGNITLSADPNEIDADNLAFSKITVNVKNNAGVGLPDIYVNLISTLGTIDSFVKTGPDGSVATNLKSGTISGNAAVMATTGIGTAVIQVKFLSTNGIIEGYVKVKDEETVLKGATVSVGTITAITDEEGKFLLENVPPGKQVIWGFADGYDDGSCRVEVIPKGTTSTTIFLTRISATGTITGRVLDKEGNVIENVITVTAGGITSTADETGNYTLSNVPAGTHTVTASAEGYQTQNRSSVIVTADTTTSGIDFRLERATGTIKGIVTAISGIKKPDILLGRELVTSIDVIPGRILPGDIGLPTISKGIPEAFVSVVGTTLSAVTDEYGNYIIKNVPLGTQTVTVSAPNYNASTSSVLIEANKTITLNFQMTPLVTTGTVSGRVTTLRKGIVPLCTGATPIVKPLDTAILKPLDTTVRQPVDATIVRPVDSITTAPLPCVSGAPLSIPMEEVGIEGAVVTVAGKSTVTDASGNYVIQNVPSGSQEVAASKAGYASQKTTVSVPAGGTITANFQLVVAVSTGTISGRVIQYSKPLICVIGGPGVSQAVGIKGAVVSVAGTALSAITDDSGNYTISSVPTGTYTVNASAQGYNTGTQGVTVNENLTTTVNFQLVLLPTTGEITGRVTNTSGTPIVSAGVKLSEVGDSVVTDASGTYRFPNERPGSHTVVVSASGYVGSSRTVNVIAGQVTAADFVLNKKILCVAGGPDVQCIAGAPNVICTGATPTILESCVSGGPGILCLSGKPGNIDVICTAAIPRIVESCISGGPLVVPVVSTPVIDRPVVSTPVIDRPVISTPVIGKKAGSEKVCLAGRPTIAPKKETQPQVKTRKGKKK